jgi:hypothetical protein
VFHVRFLRRRPTPAEPKDLLRGKSNFEVHTSKSIVAAALWSYGEDDLAVRARHMSDEELDAIEKISAWYEDPEFPLPVTGQRITHNHVGALAAIRLFEGQLRPLARSRRRPQKGLPPEYEPRPPDS